MRANANIGEILNIGSSEQLITEADNPAVNNATKAAIFFHGYQPSSFTAFVLLILPIVLAIKGMPTNNFQRRYCLRRGDS